MGGGNTWPNLKTGQLPTDDFQMKWKTFAQFNFLYNIQGTPPMDKLKKWSQEMTTSSQTKSKIRIENLQKRTLNAKQINTPWKQRMPEEINILEDNIKGHTPQN